ncbi:MAG TPA: SIS domain-containing protein, partial [Thermomicrobiales bacterium]|nr:SIS domain-containing protein [Thermomicrobiales bacterium]
DVRRVLSDGWKPAREAADRIAGAGRVFVVGIGTSYHAALMGGWLLRAAGMDARAVSSFDFATYPDNVGLRSADAVVVMAHTGVKSYSARSLEMAANADAAVVSIGSQAAEHPGSQLILRTIERERSAAYTSSHITAMTVLAQVATELGEGRGAPGVSGFRTALQALPEQIAGVLAREDEVLPISRDAVERRIYACGAGPNEIAAIEAVIKVREAAYGWIDALATEQFLHGPMVAVNEGDLNIVVNVAGSASATRVAEVTATLNGFGSKLWLVGQGVAAVPDAPVFALPETEELISPLLATVPLQILAYQMAVHKGLNPDTFRRDNPRYMEAFGLLKL